MKFSGFFPELELVETRRLILPPPFLQFISPRYLWLAYMLELLFPFLCTHRLFILQKATHSLDFLDRFLENNQEAK